MISDFVIQNVDLVILYYVPTNCIPHYVGILDGSTKVVERGRLEGAEAPIILRIFHDLMFTIYRTCWLISPSPDHELITLASVEIPTA